MELSSIQRIMFQIFTSHHNLKRQKVKVSQVTYLLSSSKKKIRNWRFHFRQKNNHYHLWWDHVLKTLTEAQGQHDLWTQHRWWAIATSRCPVEGSIRALANESREPNQSTIFEGKKSKIKKLKRIFTVLKLNLRALIPLSICSLNTWLISTLRKRARARQDETTVKVSMLSQNRRRTYTIWPNEVNKKVEKAV